MNLALSIVPGAHALMSINVRPPAVMVRGAGSYLWDEAGTRYLDFIQGWAVNSSAIAQSSCALP